MGAPIARHLLAAGVPVTVLDRDPDVVATAVRAGADAAMELGQLAADCPVVLVLLPPDQDVWTPARGRAGCSGRPGSAARS